MLLSTTFFLMFIHDTHNFNMDHELTMVHIER